MEAPACHAKAFPVYSVRKTLSVEFNGVHVTDLTQPSENPYKVKKKDWKSAAIRAGVFAGLLAFSVLILIARQILVRFSSLGYPGIFLIALISNATIFMPTPVLPVIFTLGGAYHPLWVGVVAGIGGAIGEITGYLAGLGGRAIIERAELYAKIQPWVSKYGGWAILLLAAVPNPLFDMAGIAAGVSKMPLGKFMLYCTLGQMIKMIGLAYAGHFALQEALNLGWGA
jgi:uncharacterized membrane protein YdjX (TVP38/TMEM64 family)